MKNIWFHIFAFCLLLLPLGAVGQTVEVGQLDFCSDYEAELFAADQAGEAVDPLAFLLAMSPEMTEAGFLTHKRGVEAEFAALKAEAPGKQVNARQLGWLFRQLRSAHFREYQAVADLGDVLRTGDFNCVSSSALMGLALDHFGISWELVEQPGHVFLYAVCKGRTYQVETTSETIGVFPAEQANLRLFAQVGEQGRAAMPTTDAMRQLAGLQYYNDGLEAMDLEAYPRALDQFGKAWLLNPDRQVAEMWEVAVEAVVAEGKDFLIHGQPELALQRFYKVRNAAPEAGTYRLAVMGAVLMQVERSHHYADNLALIDAAIADYPFLREMEGIGQAVTDCWLLMANQAFTAEDIATGDAALQQFEKACGDQLHIANAPLAAHVYAEGWTRLVKAGQLEAAEQMLARALRFAPESKDLARKQRAMLAMGQ